MGRIFSHLYDIMMQPAEWRMMGEIRRRVAGAATGHVLEVGVGSGLNLPYYRDVERVVGVDPDVILLERAKKRAHEINSPVTLELISAESLPFADQSFDTVVGTLVFCTIPDAGQALREIKRVLKPDGRFVLVEHVRAEHTVLASLQDIVTPVWKWCFGGCYPNRNTEASSLQRRHVGKTFRDI